MRKSPSSWLLLATCLGAAFMSGCSWDDPYETNSDLVLLLAEDGLFPSRPTPSPDGRLVYYLGDSTPRGPVIGEAGGDLYVLATEDGTNRLLLAGDFSALAVSPDGSRLALVSRNPPAGTTLFMLLDTGATTVDSLQVANAGNEHLPSHAAFASDGTALVYCTRLEASGDTTYFFAVCLDGDSAPTVIHKVPWHQRVFDLLAGDSIYTDSLVRGHRSAVNPVHLRWTLYPESNQTVYYWVLHDRQTDQRIPFGEQARPYHGGLLGWPSWSKDGDNLLFVSRRKANSHLEIWMLRNASRYLPGSQ